MNTKPNFNLDRTFFTVISALESGTIYQPEIDPDWNRSTVLEMAKEGQFETVLAIIESNPVEGGSRTIPAELIDDEIQIEARASQRRMHRFPNDEHRIGNFEAGTGSFGPFAGRAA
ncbi:hypothetical protein [Roseibium alexandrii]|uniref:hypothetical protein n=1 Tax=Roseibium alexandrii TaxID=388408 RepID=UPI00375240B4